MQCKHCGQPLPEGSQFCGYCGKPQSVETVEIHADTSEKSRKIIPIVAASVTTTLILAILLILMGGGSTEAPVGVQPDVSVETLAPEVTEETCPLPESNPYFQCYIATDDYVLPESSSAYLNFTHVENLTLQQLEIALEELYARHGKAFANNDVQAYFDARDWYKNTGTSVELNDFEAANEVLLQVRIAQVNGTTVSGSNPYIQIDSNAAGYMISDSNSRYLSAGDLRHLNAAQLEAARNEIFARHGYIFSNENLRQYFYTKQWYAPKTVGDDFDNEVLNKFEQNNIKMIKIYERRLNGVTFSSGNPNAPYFGTSASYIIYDSNYRALSPYELYYYSERELVLARNEIFARHGYTFGDENLLEYFLQKSWYEPTTPIGDNNAVQLSSVELANVNLLLEFEKGTYQEPTYRVPHTGLTSAAYAPVTDRNGTVPKE